MGGFNTFLKNITGQTDRARGRSETQKGIDAINNVKLPELQDLVQTGQYTPEELAQSSLSQYQDDPAVRQAQLQALQSLQGQVDAGGLDAQTKARLSQTMNDTASQERGSREAILANERARGLGGSGAELAAQLSNQQGSAQRLNQQGLDIASIGEQNKAQALRDLASVGGNIRSQDFGQAESKARAQDSINQFNAQNTNQSRLYNQQEAQIISDYNRTQLPQQQYNNQLQKASGVQQGYNQQANNYNAQGQATAGITSGVIQGGATIAAPWLAPAKAATPTPTPSDERVKKDVEPFDSSSFLDDLTGVKFRYTHPEKYGEGQKAGVFAQDVEKNNPDAVSEDGEGIKKVDYSKLSGPMLASLADINKRLKKIEDSNG